MSLCLPAAITASLWLVLQGSSAVVPVTEERRVAAEGSSILMQAPDIEHMNVLEWEYTGNSTSTSLLQYFAGSQSLTVHAPYRDRVVFYPGNGSVLLQGLQESDGGIYKATVDLMQNKTRKTLLRVIKPVPQPELQCRSSLAGSPIELVCLVPEGTAAAISWNKEGQPLPPEKCSVLSENFTVLRIREGEKSDCGFYSCNVSNVISWKEATLNLTVTGLSAPLQHAQRLAIVALMFVTVSTVGFVILLCKLGGDMFGEDECKHLSLYSHVLLCVSSLLLLAASIIWMQEQGLSAAFVLLGLFFFAAAAGAAWVAAATVWRPAALSHSNVCRVICSSTGPTTLMVSLLFALLLLHNIQQLHERGCSEAVKLTPGCVPAAVALVIMMLAILFRCYWSKRMEKTKKNHPSSQRARGTDTPAISWFRRTARSFNDEY